jgi:integrase
MIQINIGSYAIAMKYLFKRSNRNTYYYKRRVPKDLQAHYPKPFIEISLKQNDQTLAAVLCEQQHQKIEQQFARLRQGLPKDQVLTNYESALNYLDAFNLSPQDAYPASDGAELARERLYEAIDDTIRDQTSSEAYRAIHQKEAAFPLHLLTDEKRSALAIIQGKFRLTASQYPTEYLRLRDKVNDRKVTHEAHRAINSLIAICGDRAPSEYSRSDLNKYIKENCLVKKTTTVQRQLKTIAAMFNMVSLEMDIALDRNHPFRNFKIPNLGNDSKDRQEFSADQIKLLRHMPLSKTPEITHLIQLMLDTGMRVSECCGLMVKDIHLEVETPYLQIYRNNVRDLKTKNSRRLIPLVGSSLSAMQEAVSRSTGDFIFPRYVDEASGSIKENNASAACKKRLVALLGKDTPTSHGFRHTLNTRLRNAECPKDIRNELQGWAKGISDRYGSPSDLKVKAKYLNATL